MAKSYKPATPFTVPFHIITPVLGVVKGVTTKTFTEGQTTFFCSFRTFGGTELTENGLYSVVDTATIETWFDPAITAGCRIKTLDDNKVYEVIGTPEDIEKRHQFLKFKVQSISGGA